MITVDFWNVIIYGNCVDTGVRTNLMDGGFPTDMFGLADRESVRLIVTGSPDAVTRMIRKLHSQHIADPNDWSPPQRARHSDEVISLLIQRV